MKLVRTIFDLRQYIALWRSKKWKIGLVPTMGGVHEGHLSLVRLASRTCDRVIATVFVNPIQFSLNEDFEEYPRNEDADTKLFARAGADLVFAPSLDEMYPVDCVTRIVVDGVGDVLEGKFRPGFFSGVATVVGKLLIQSLPDIAVFGEKDYQQLCVIRAMVRDLNVPVKIVSGDTVREADGLAMSSRNAYLNANQRSIAPALNLSLNQVAELMREGQDIETVCLDISDSLVKRGFSNVDYVSVCDAKTLQPLKVLDRPARVLGAAWLGETRLIDNIKICPV